MAREFNIVNKTFVKSSNKSHLIIARYGYTLIAFSLLTILCLILNKHSDYIYPLVKSLGISLITCLVCGYILNIIKKDYSFTILFTKDYLHITAIIIGLFAINTNYLVTVAAGIISVLVKFFSKKINLSASLYGILIILLYKQFMTDYNTPLTNFITLNYHGSFNELVTKFGTLKEYLLGYTYLSPLLSVIAFLYLFHKKSIKYTIVLSYILTFSTIIFFYGLYNEMPWFIYFELVYGNLLFLTAFTISDYMISPTLIESQLIYGLILGIISAILRFIIPELAIVIPFILGPILLTKPLENISPKLKYNKKTYILSLSISLIMIIITTVSLIIIF